VEQHIIKTLKIKMSRSINNGWDFLEVGETYQYKESSFIAMVTIMADTSDDEMYEFDLRIEESNYDPPQNGRFTITSSKENHGVYSGMLQFYEEPEYYCAYEWKRKED
jgi:glutamate synthase domain-containing protein 1